jgi:cell filamentation protein
VDRAQKVMVNHKGITTLRKLQEAEEDALAQAHERLLGEVTTTTPLTVELLLYIHRCIFGDLYEWAGRWRTVRISKPGAQWPPPDYLDAPMRAFEVNMLQKHRASTLHGDKQFCLAAAEIQGEFLSIHPFREGNARTIKLVTDLLASQTDRPLLKYDMSPSGIKQYIAAAKEALHHQRVDLLEQIIGEALLRAITPS